MRPELLQILLVQINIFLLQYLRCQCLKSRQVLSYLFAKLVEISDQKVRFDHAHLQALDDYTGNQRKSCFSLLFEN